MAPSRGICFRDTYLDDQFKSAPKSKTNNCYIYLDYDYDITNVDAETRRVAT